MAASHRLWITSSLLLLVELCVLYIQFGYAPAQFLEPQHNVTELPNELGAWQGEPVTIDPRLTVAVGAKTSTNRVFRHATQPDIMFHSAIWTETNFRPPHPPEACYSNSGWEKREQETVLIGKPSETQITAALITWRRDGGHLRTLHWYHRGEHSFFDTKGSRGVHRNFWGQTEWPHLAKILLQTSHQTGNQSRERLIVFAEKIRQWMQTVR